MDMVSGTGLGVDKMTWFYRESEQDCQRRNTMSWLTVNVTSLHWVRQGGIIRASLESHRQEIFTGFIKAWLTSWKLVYHIQKTHFLLMFLIHLAVHTVLASYTQIFKYLVSWRFERNHWHWLFFTVSFWFGLFQIIGRRLVHEATNRSCLEAVWLWLHTEALQTKTLQQETWCLVVQHKAHFHDCCTLSS